MADHADAVRHVPDNQGFHMSTTPDQTEDGGFIKTPKQLFTVVALLIVGVVAVFLAINIIVPPASSGDAHNPEAVESRIAPVARLVLVPTESERVLKTGEEVYKSTCSSCHAAGVSGAPIFGNVDAWQPFIATGFEEMLNVALHGKNAMPAKGGNPTLSDYEVARAVVYIANNSGASFEEPAAPEAAAD